MVDQGRLLLFTVDMLTQELSKRSWDEPHPCKDEIDSALAQCFYCLYGHPNKRAKAKHLDDHNVNSVSKASLHLLFDSLVATVCFFSFTASSMVLYIQVRRIF
jgi:hypothetical protein